MLYRYVFFKTTWYADIATTYEVSVSEQLLSQLEARPEDYDLTLLIFHLLRLSKGQLVIGTNFKFMSPHRISKIGRYMFSWVAYDLMSLKSCTMSAILPRRLPEVELRKIPDTEMSEPHLKSFRIALCAMLLNIFDVNLEEQVQENI